MHAAVFSWRNVKEEVPVVKSFTVFFCFFSLYPLFYLSQALCTLITGTNGVTSSSAPSFQSHCLSDGLVKLLATSPNSLGSNFG